MPVRLSKVAREFNVGISTIVEFLQDKGIKISSDPHILGFLASLWPRQAVRGGVWRRFRQLVHCLSKGKRFPVFPLFK